MEPTRSTQARLADWVLVWSGLWGAVRLTDPIPAYRLSGAVTLPGPGRLAAFWREPLRRALAEPARDGLVVDLRSGDLRRELDRTTRAHRGDPGHPRAG